VEAFNGFGYVFIFAVNGFSWLSILLCLLFSLYIVISVIDWRTFEIPVGLTISVLVIGIVRVVLDYGNVMNYLAGFCTVSLFMTLVLYIGRATKGVDAFGGGDIKLMAAAGLFVGWKNIILAFLIGCILGAVIHSIRMKLSNEDHVLAFGPYLCAGLFIAMLFGDTLITWYLGLIL
jgi:leader peptidase (prepilin peptidase)/N-methyltransferase